MPISTNEVGIIYDKDTFEISEKLFSAVDSYIDERMVKPDVRMR